MPKSSEEKGAYLASWYYGGKRNANCLIKKKGGMGMAGWVGGKGVEFLPAGSDGRKEPERAIAKEEKRAIFYEKMLGRKGQAWGSRQGLGKIWLGERGRTTLQKEGGEMHTKKNGGIKGKKGEGFHTKLSLMLARGEGRA